MAAVLFLFIYDNFTTVTHSHLDMHSQPYQSTLPVGRTGTIVHVGAVVGVPHYWSHPCQTSSSHGVSPNPPPTFWAHAVSKAVDEPSRGSGHSRNPHTVPLKFNPEPSPTGGCHGCTTMARKKGLMGPFPLWDAGVPSSHTPPYVPSEPSTCCYLFSLSLISQSSPLNSHLTVHT